MQRSQTGDDGPEHGHETRRPYTSPALTDLGSVAELTETGGPQNLSVDHVGQYLSA